MSPDAAEASRWRGAERLLGIVAALLLVALTLLTCIDVIGRYFLDRPLTGAFELTELAMGALVFSSLPLVSLHRQQVTVDLFEWLIPRAWRRVQNAIIDLSAAACVGVIAWQLWRRAVNMAAAGETTATLQIPVYPLVGYMALLAGVTVVLMLAMAWTDATGKGATMNEALLAFAAMLLLAFARMPIAFAMGLVGFAGFALKASAPAALAMVGAVSYETGLSYALSVVPLFVLMGNLVTRAGLSEELYEASHAFLGHRKGGLAMATIVACGGFSAICGSSVATAATMAKVAVQPMREHGYSDALATGSVAAGGTLGILIPPSVVLVIYGILTQQNIGKLFIAGILPGLVAVLCYLGAIAVTVRLDPTAGPPGPYVAWPARLRALRRVWGVLALFVLVLGGIYGGVFTPTEAAAIGAGGAFVFAIFRRGWSTAFLRDVLVESAVTTGMLFTILIGALVFANFVNLTTMPAELIAFTERFASTPMLVIVAICAIYVLLGCVLESMSMILLTVPMFYPVVQHLGFDLIWFGIIVVVVTEISLITPPVGLNVFVLRSVLPDIPTREVFRGVMPFVMSDLVRLAILIGFPGITLYLTRFVA